MIQENHTGPYRRLRIPVWKELRLAVYIFVTVGDTGPGCKSGLQAGVSGLEKHTSRLLSDNYMVTS